MAWSGLLPLARLVEACPEITVEIPPEDEGQPAQELRRSASSRVGVDKSLVSCLVDRWRPETHTFHFPWGEMAPTLQDVSYLLGLPLAGEVIGPMEAPLGWRDAMQARFAGVAPGNPQLLFSTHGVRQSWLLNFQVIPALFSNVCSSSIDISILTAILIRCRLINKDTLMCR